MPEESTHSRSVTVAGGTIELSWAGVTHTGRRREINQDALLDAATRCSSWPTAWAATSAARSRVPARSTGSAASSRRARSRRRRSRRPSSRAVKDIASHPETTDDGTGTTLTGVYLDLSDDAAAVGHAQHRRLPRLPAARRDRSTQITTDHSVVQELDRGRAAQPRRGREPPVRQRDHARRRPERERRPRLRPPRRRRRRPVRHLLRRAHERAHRLRDPALPRREPGPRRCGRRDAGCRARERRPRQHHDHRARCRGRAPSRRCGRPSRTPPQPETRRLVHRF